MHIRWILAIAVAGASLVFPRSVPAGPPLMEGFFYQGYLKDGGLPANDEYDFEFKLFDSYAGGVQLGAAATRENVEVIDGVFKVYLLFDIELFNEQDLYLQVETRAGDGAGPYTVLSPRQELAGVPYAIYAGRAGGLMMPYEDTVSSTGDAFSITNDGGGVAGAFIVTDPTAHNPAVWVDTNSAHHGVVARATGTGSAGSFAIDNPANNSPALIGKSDGGGIAVYGEQRGTGRAGFFLNVDAANESDALEAKTQGAGRAGHFHIENSANGLPALTAATDGTGPAIQALAYGGGRAGEFNVTESDNDKAAVFGWTQGKIGKAVQGWASAASLSKNYGGFFVADGDSGEGVYGKSNGARGRGVVGEADGSSSVGVYGTTGTGTGVFGEATASRGLTYGVRGLAPSANGYAGYFSGRGYFAGRLGAGTPDPDQQLHVDGNAKVTGWIGTDDFEEVTLRTDNKTALRLQPAESDTHGFAPNVVGGHSGNYVELGEQGAFIGGGGYTDPIPQVGPRPNRVIGSFGAVVGGYNNEAGIGSYVGGGIGNVAGNDNVAEPPYGQWATVAGGQGNDATNFCTTIGGGVNNEANGSESTVAGGSRNITGDPDDPPWPSLGRWATVGGGNYNNAKAAGSTIPGGAYAEARMPYQFAYAAGAFGSERGSAQTSIYVVRELTYSRGPYTMSDGSAALYVHDGKTWAFDIQVVARAEGGASAAYQITGAIKRAGPTTSFIGTPMIRTLGEDTLALGWGVSVDINDFFTDHELEIKVTGADDTTIRWVATVRTTEVSWEPQN